MKLPFKVDLSNKVAVITGGTGVLGSYWVDALARCGAKVAILGRKKEIVEKKAKVVIDNGGIAIGLVADVMNIESLREAHIEVLNKLGPCDILINGAGGNSPKANTTNEYLYEEDIKYDSYDITTFFDLEEDAVKQVFGLNFMGTFVTSQEFVKDMVGRKGCTVINISSMNAFTPLTKIPAYSGAKSAVSNFTQWLAVHLSKVGIRVNAIAPGFLLTKQNESLLLNSDGSYTDRAKKIINSTPMMRFGEPKELIGALLFLVSEEASSFVNGVIIPVDGGFSVYSGV